MGYRTYLPLLSTDCSDAVFRMSLVLVGRHLAEVSRSAYRAHSVWPGSWATPAWLSDAVALSPDTEAPDDDAPSCPSNLSTEGRQRRMTLALQTVLGPVGPDLPQHFHISEQPIFLFQVSQEWSGLEVRLLPEE